MYKHCLIALYSVFFAHQVCFADSLITFKKNTSPPAETTHAMLVPIDQATLASQFTGEIENISVRDGDHFKKGEVLVEFNCAVKKTELAKTEADVEHAKATWKSAQTLDKLKSISKLELDKAKFNYKKSELAVKHLQAQIQQCTITAPYDGKVIEIMAHSHEDVSPSQPLMKIINDRNLEIKFYIPSNWLAWIKVGTKFTIHFNEINHSLSAHISKIGAQIDTASQTINVFGKLDKEDPRLISGMSGKVSFEEPSTIKE